MVYKMQQIDRKCSQENAVANISGYLIEAMKVGQNVVYEVARKIE